MRSSTKNLRDLIVFALLGVIVFVSDILMDFAPNVHFIAGLLVSYTVVYKRRALIPLYVYVLLLGLFNGFGIWWIGHLYIWLPLVFIAMLIPKKLEGKKAVIAYMTLCGAHGLLFGVMYTPVYAFMMKLSFKGALSSIVIGLPYDIIHCIGNVASGAIVVPLSQILKKLDSRI